MGAYGVGWLITEGIEMTFDDDMIQFEFEGGTKRIFCKQLGVDWPPPKEMAFMGFDMERQQYSAITDEQRQEMTHVFRGAVYAPAGAVGTG